MSDEGGRRDEGSGGPEEDRPVRASGDPPTEAAWPTVIFGEGHLWNERVHEFWSRMEDNASPEDQARAQQYLDQWMRWARGDA